MTLSLLLPTVATVATLLAGAGVAIAQPLAPLAQSNPSTNTTRTDLLQYDLRIDVPLTVVGALGWVASEALKSQLAPKACRWCDLNAFDRWGRDTFRLSNGQPSSIASDVIAFGLTPLAAFGLDLVAAGREGRYREFLVDGLLMAESLACAADLTQIAKYAAARERPFVHALPTTAKSKTATPADNNASFWSGHTDLAFALATAAGTVATLRGYRLALLIWGLGVSFAVVTGYLRVAADQHYLSDVITGSVVGSAVGVAVPLVHSPRVRRALRGGAPTVAGAGLAINWRW
jgi:membrane-associated phospholipid phosphatase